MTTHDPYSYLADFCSIVRKKLREPVRCKDIIEDEIEERLHHHIS